MNIIPRTSFRSLLPVFCGSTLFLSMLTLQSCAITSGVEGEDGRTRDKATSDWQTQQLFLEVNQAEAAYQAGRWKAASRHYRLVLEQMPDDSHAWFRLGNSLTRQGQYSHAIHAFETSLQHDARQIKPWFNLSTAHLLGAQLATLRAREVMTQDDPSRQAIQFRLDTLTQLLQ